MTKPDDLKHSKTNLETHLLEGEDLYGVPDALLFSPCPYPHPNSPPHFNAVRLSVKIHCIIEKMLTDNFWISGFKIKLIREFQP